MDTNEKIINYVIDRIKTEFLGSIDLLLCYGSYINGTAHAKSDLDLYFIPRTEEGYGLSETFILNGIGYDIFGMPWDRVNRIADMEESISPLVGDVKILYSYSDHEIEKFTKLQQQMREHLHDANYMRSRACDRVKTACFYYDHILSELSLGKVRMGMGFILMSLAEAVAYMNQTYFHQGLKTQYTDLQGFEKQPTDLIYLYHDCITEHDIRQIKEKCKTLITNTIAFLEADDEIAVSDSSEMVEAKETTADQKEDREIDYNHAAKWYEELSSTFNKIYVCAESKNYVLAFISACCLQSSLESDLEMKLKTTDLLSEFKYDDLQPLTLKAREIELDCIAEIENHQVMIRRVCSVEQLNSNSSKQ